jgi:hypothetical protein
MKKPRKMHMEFIVFTWNRQPRKGLRKYTTMTSRYLHLEEDFSPQYLHSPLFANEE